MFLNFLFHEDTFYSIFSFKKISEKKLAKNLLGSGSGSGRFQKSDPDPDSVKNRPDPQHCIKSTNFANLFSLTFHPDWYLRATIVSAGAFSR
jgi:hypothetical protein